MASAPDNAEIAEVLERVAELLEAQDGDVYRVRAYRNAAATARSESRSLAELLEEGGRPALVALPAIGRSIAASIDELVHAGRLSLLARLEGQVSPEDLFTSVPGIGEGLAHAIHEHLHVETLEELELAAHDGRLETVPGVGPRRARAIRAVLAGLLSRSARRRARRVQPPAAEPPAEEPEVAVLLDVDAEYRRRAAEDDLRRIAPRRFNPEHKAWLPVLHTRRGDWQLTAMFSNTARAHAVGKTDDWVVIYFERDGHEGQCTAVTETRGRLAGYRVIRGRERESGQWAAAPG